MATLTGPPPTLKRKSADQPPAAKLGPEIGVLRLPWWSRAPAAPPVGIELVPHVLLLRCPQHRHECRWYRGSQASDGHGQIVSEALRYTPTSDDIGSELAVECVVLRADGSQIDSTRRSVWSGAVCPNVALPPPDRRVAGFATDACEEFGAPERLLRVISYNILAPCLASERMFPYAPPWSLDWAYRRGVLHAELALLAEGADVLCLQEVQPHVFEELC
eukprot:4308649-Prymnesium_polylepis.1